MRITARRAVEDYLNASKIVPVQGLLAEDLANENEAVLDLLAYAVKRFGGSKAVYENVRLLSRAGLKDNDGERVYENRLTELMALYFVQETLGRRITRLEAKSPFATGNKLCDIEAVYERQSVFFEVKDLSSEILSQKPDKNFETFLFEPALPADIVKWIAKYVANCLEKGANYLICSVPAWHVCGFPKLTAEWVQAMYPDFEQVDERTYRVVHGLHLKPFFHGAYVLRRQEHILLSF